MTIRFTRDSVCMEEDAGCWDFQFADNAGIQAVVSMLQETRCLPSAADLVWVLENSDGEELLACYTRTDRILYRAGQGTLPALCGGTPALHFVCYASPAQRAARLRERSGLNEYDFWKRLEIYRRESAAAEKG